MTDLTHVSTHYEFGQNWRRFADTVDASRIQNAITSLHRLAPIEEIQGKAMLDIGCGSGLHALAALLSGAKSVTAIDIDSDSVATTRALLERFAPGGSSWTAEVRSVFEITDLPRFDVVYSWGVLHHTGQMERAVRCAADRVSNGGMLYLALYRKTPFCGFWRAEKRFYTQAPPVVRHTIEAVYIAAFRTNMLLRGADFKAYVSHYHANRGMHWMTDVRDWLGGYPYESISEAEMLEFSAKLDLMPVRRFCHPPGLGVFGSGCDEYAFRKGTCQQL